MVKNMILHGKRNVKALRLLILKIFPVFSITNH